MKKSLNSNSSSNSSELRIDSIKTYVYEIPTDLPESDGTIKWDSTTLIIVAITSDQNTGLGFTYGHKSVREVIRSTFEPILLNANVMNVVSLWEKMLEQSRNIGTRGIVASAIAAVDIALWDLKAKILKVPLCTLLGMARESVPVYGSGGFTSYTDKQLAEQFENWMALGINKFKMKVGREPKKDLLRVRHARSVIGTTNELFVDANGAYTHKQALDFAEKFAKYNVSWFEEPVSSDDLSGLNRICNRAPAGMNIAAGEYGYDIFYFKRMLEAHSVDVLQSDATRCCGYTVFFQACDLCRAFNLPLSSHCAPAFHLHACLSQSVVCHMEYFHDHVRIEEMFFEGLPKLIKGCLYPDLNKLGHGLSFKEKELQPFLSSS